jgi:hypothetical protein
VVAEVTIAFRAAVAARVTASTLTGWPVSSQVRIVSATMAGSSWATHARRPGSGMSPRSVLSEFRLAVLLISSA